MKKALLVAVGVGAALWVSALLVRLLLPLVACITTCEDSARTEVKSIETALKVYLNDYSKFPEYGSCRLQSTGAGQSDATLTDILRGINTNATANPRAIVYLDINEGSLGTNVVTASGGSGVAGAFYDPWGNLYQIAVDHQFSNRVAHADGETLINRTVAVWSWGPHKTAKPDPSDKTHIRSWK